VHVVLMERSNLYWSKSATIYIYIYGSIKNCDHALGHKWGREI
jgi:hypothetical protein